MHKPLKCPHCHKLFPIRQTLDFHVWRRHMTDEERYKAVEERQKGIPPMSEKDWAELKKGE